MSFLNPASPEEPGVSPPVAASTTAVSFINPAPVTEPGGSQPSASAVTSVGFASGPVVYSVTPTQLSRGAGGGIVTIRGMNLHNASAVTFDTGSGITASTPSVSADGQTVSVNVTLTPQATTGVVVVRVVTPAGTSPPVAAAALEIVQ